MPQTATIGVGEYMLFSRRKLEEAPVGRMLQLRYNVDQAIGSIRSCLSPKGNRLVRIGPSRFRAREKKCVKFASVAEILL